MYNETIPKTMNHKTDVTDNETLKLLYQNYLDDKINVDQYF